MNDDRVAGGRVFGVKRLLYPERAEMLPPHEPSGIAIACETEFKARYPLVSASIHDCAA